MALALLSPIPGSLSNCSNVAVFKSKSPFCASVDEVAALEEVELMDEGAGLAATEEDVGVPEELGVWSDFKSALDEFWIEFEVEVEVGDGVEVEVAGELDFGVTVVFPSFFSLASCTSKASICVLIGMNAV